MPHLLLRYLSPNIYGALLISCMALLSALHNALLHTLSKLYPAIQILCLKSLVALTIVVILTNKHLKLTTNNLSWHFARSICALVGIFTLILAQKHLQLAEVAIFSATSAIFTSLGASVFFKEGVPLLRWFYILLGFIGVIIITINFNTTISLNYLLILPLLSALAFSASSLIIKKTAMKDNSATNLFYLLTFLICISFIPTMLTWVKPNIFDLCLLTGLGLVSVMMQFCLIEAYSYAQASFIAPFKFIKYPTNLMVGIYFFHESINTSTIWGGIMIGIVMLLVLLSEKNITLRIFAQKSNNQQK